MMLEEGAGSRRGILLVVLLLAVLGYVVHQYLYRPRAGELVLKEARLESLREWNAVARTLVERTEVELLERRIVLLHERLVEMEAWAPFAEELTELLDAISDEARRAGVELQFLRPSARDADAYYARHTYAIGVIGRYHGIGRFLASTASLPRIVIPTDLAIRVREENPRTEDPLLQATLTIETYVVPPDSSRYVIENP